MLDEENLFIQYIMCLEDKQIGCLPREIPEYQENGNSLCFLRGTQQRLIDLAVRATTSLPCVSLCIIL